MDSVLCVSVYLCVFYFVFFVSFFFGVSRSVMCKYIAQLKCFLLSTVSVYDEVYEDLDELSSVQDHSVSV